MSGSFLWAQATFQSNGVGNWNNAGSWTRVSGTDADGIPDSDDTVEIVSGHTITLTQNEACAALTITSGTIDLNASTLSVTGAVTINGTLDDGVGGGTLTIGGNFTLNSGASIDPNVVGINFTFNGSGTQTVSGTYTGAIDVFNFTKSGSGTLDWNLAITVQISGSMTLSAGTFQAGAATYTFASGGTVFTKSGGTFTAETSTFEFVGNTTTTVITDASITFYNITHNPALTRTLRFDESDGGGGTITYTVSNNFNRSGKSASVSLLNQAALAYSTGASLTFSFSGIASEVVSSEWPSTNGPGRVNLNTTATVNLAGSRTVDTLLVAGGGTIDINTGNTLTIGKLLEIQNGTVTVNGTLSYSAGSLLKYNTSTEYAVGDEWSTTTTPSNVEIAGAGAELITNHSGATLQVGENTGIPHTNGDITFNATLRHNGTVQVRGDVVGGSGNFGVANNGTLELIDNEDTAVDLSNTFTVRNFIVNKTSGTATLTAGSTLKLDANTSSSTLRVQAGTLAFSTSAAGLSLVNGGTFTLQVDNGATLKTGGKDITGFNTYSFGASSTVEFNGNSAEVIPSATYGNVTVNNTATSADVSLGGNLTLQSNATFTVSSGRVNLGGNTLTLNGNNGLVVSSGATLRTADAAGTTTGTDITGFSSYTVTGTLVFNGVSGDEVLPSGVSGQNFNLTVSKAAGNLTVSTAMTVGGNLNVVNGTLATTGTGSISVSGTTSNSGSISLSGSNASTFTGAFTNSGALTFNSGAGDVTFNGAYSGSGTISATGASPNVTFNSSFSPGGNATFGSQTLTLAGNVNVTGGTFTPSSSTSFTGTTFQVSGSGAVSNSSGTITFAGSGAQTISGAVTFNNLTVNNASGVSITGGNPSVAGTLTLTSGVVSTGSNTLILGASASISGGGTGSYVSGKLAHTFTTTQTTKVYPLGNGGKFRQIKLVGSTSTGTAVMTGSIISQGATNVTTTLGGSLTNVSDLRYYQFVNSSSAVSITQLVDVRVNDDDQVGSFVSNTSLRLASTVGTGGTWNERSLSSTPNTTTFPVDITSTTFTESVGATQTFYVTLGSTSSSDNPLPVELSSFVAEAEPGKIILKWSTASEVNNEGYYIFRGESEAGPFVQLNTTLIPGHGNSNVTRQYEFEDTQVEENVTYYYKLRSVDFDGTIHDYGTMVSATALPVPKAFALAQNYPNPFNPSTHLKFTVAKAGSVTLMVYNMLGQKVRTILDHEYLQPGIYTEYSWDATDDLGRPVAAGMYYLVFLADDGRFKQIRKMVYIR